jgi:hypothetical protein
MPARDDPDMHESMQRLLDFAKKATAGTSKAIRTFTDVGSRMGVSSAVLSNWKGRGISRDGALQAEAVFGCSAQWLRTGNGPTAAATHEKSDATEPVPIGRRLYTAKEQQQIMDDLGDLIPEEAEQVIADLRERAEKSRRHRDYILGLVPPTGTKRPQQSRTPAKGTRSTAGRD